MIANDIVRQVWSVMEPELAAQGYELVEVELARGNRGLVLRLFIDKPGGVTLDDCQAVSHLVGALLDAGDYITEHYMLEISSPGFDRPIRKPADFARFVGERVKLTTEAPVSGRKRFSGVLRKFEDGLVTVECAETLYEVHIENLRKANLDR